MNNGSLSVVEFINLYLPKEYELIMSTSTVEHIEVWQSEFRNFKLTINKLTKNYILVNEKRMIEFNPEIIESCVEIRHELIISILGDIGINVSVLKNVKILNNDDGAIYVMNVRDSYGDVTSYEYTTKRDFIFEKNNLLPHTLGLTYKNRCSELHVNV